MQIRLSSISAGFPAQIKRIGKKFSGWGEKFSLSGLMGDFRIGLRSWRRLNGGRNEGLIGNAKC
jgi:hypothetical protein